MAGKPLKDGEDDQIMNPRPPDITSDFGVSSEEDRLDRELMPDGTAAADTPSKRRKT